MSGDFRFKRFGIKQDSTAMKVGTDAVLLGAWAHVERSTKRILDIGTGTGVIALMLAQRTESAVAQICAVEIDDASSRQAAENFASSPWSERLKVENIAVQDFAAEPFDLIVSNPPYFRSSLLPKEDARAAARHTLSLTYNELLRAAERLLAQEGRLAVILPADSASDFIIEALHAGLYSARRTETGSKANGKPLRTLLELTRTPQPELRKRLAIHTPDGGYTEEYKTLTRDFYLNF